MVNLKLIKPEGVNSALDKAHHYRLLNEPLHAESICLDVLEVDSKNQRATVMLVLALTDQFPSRLHEAHEHALSLIPQLNSEYDRWYYEGIVHERWASAQYESGMNLRSVPEWLSKAMDCYERAEKLTKSQNPDPILRWNACARLCDKACIVAPEHESLMRDIDSEFGGDVQPTG